MKITCPKCNASGSIPDHEIPESGRFISCPRCNEGFNVTKPRSNKDAYLVDTCPACSFSTFGDENFSTCPKCGVSVKAFIERQREEQLQKRNQELLAKKINNTEAAPQPPPQEAAAPMADFIENLHPVNLIGWGVALVAIVFLGLGLWGIIGYDTAKIQAQILEERDEQVSAMFVFLHYGLMPWLKFLYGGVALAVAFLFIKHLKKSLKALSVLLHASIALTAFSYIGGFIVWVQAPISHTVSGYVIEILNAVFMCLLVGVPLYFLEQFLHERKITSVVKL